jgi:hypothetical protein
MVRSPYRVPISVGLLLGLFAPHVQAADPSFSRHVVPLFSRLGCNAGSCHGSVKGRGGFRLSLFGAEPAGDHAHLLRDVGGRRLDLIAPDDSLLLKKATGQVAHEGGTRMTKGSPEYRTIRAWVAAGAQHDAVEKSAIKRLSIAPAQKTAKLGESYPLRVTAEFADGTSEDVTALCTFEPANKELARMDASGRAHALAVGDTALIARYRGEPAVAMLVVPREGKEPFPQVAPDNFIDAHILDKLRRLNVHPSEVCDDATFLRRVHLDVIGLPPTPDEVRAFLADKSPDKRRRKIDQLLAHPGHAATWATKFCDILRPTGFDGRHGFTEAAETRRFYEWLRARMAENTPYDQLAERILLATSREGRPDGQWEREVQELVSENTAKGPGLKAYAHRRTLDLYWQRGGGGGVRAAMQVSHAFLGLRMGCAQCHRHPHDVWRQDDLLSFANFFMRVSHPVGSAPTPAVAKEVARLTMEVKALKEAAKKAGMRTKDKSLPKEEIAKIQAEVKALNAKAQLLESTGRRLKATEVHVQAKPAFASVTSPLGRQESRQFRLLGDRAALAVPADKDPREVVMAWLRKPDNPYFARAIVNRVWAHYMGRGIIDPPDQLSPLNPASHPELLDALCVNFVRSGYDLRHLHRTILLSRTYQQSAKTNATNRTDKNHASFYLRRLPAEVLVDALNHATGGSETYPPELYMPAGARAMEVAGSAGSERAQASFRYAFQIFGRPMRLPEGQCDCGRDTSPAVVQTLYLANHPAVRKKISSPTGRLTQILKDISDEGKRVDELYLWALSRMPEADERAECVKYVKESLSARAGLEDVMWALLNSKEFLLNH